MTCWVSALGYQACKVSQNFMFSIRAEKSLRWRGCRTVNKGLWHVARGCLQGRDQGYHGDGDQQDFRLSASLKF